MRIIFASVLFLSFTLSFAQESEVVVGEAFGKPLNHSVARAAKSLDDIFAYFPHSWIESYRLVRVTIIRDGKETIADGKTPQLNAAQLKLLQGAAIGDHVSVVVDFMSKNSVTNLSEPGSMKNEFTLMAEKPAVFPLGAERFRKSVLQYAMDRIQPADLDKAVGAKVWFQIDENGIVEGKRIIQSSGDMSIDRVLLEAVERQPRWTPASDANGTNFFRQEFALALVKKGC